MKAHLDIRIWKRRTKKLKLIQSEQGEVKQVSVHMHLPFSNRLHDTDVDDGRELKHSTDALNCKSIDQPFPVLFHASSATFDIVDFLYLFLSIRETPGVSPESSPLCPIRLWLDAVSVQSCAAVVIPFISLACGDNNHDHPQHHYHCLFLICIHIILTNSIGQLTQTSLLLAAHSNNACVLRLICRTRFAKPKNQTRCIRTLHYSLSNALAVLGGVGQIAFEVAPIVAVCINQRVHLSFDSL